MKITCTRKNLTKGLNNCSKVISGGTGTLPILSNILFKTENGRLKLSATNLEIAINTWVGGVVEEEGEITVPARLVNDFVGTLLAEKVSISTKGIEMTLETEKTKTHIKGLSAEDFPLIPKISDGVFAKILAEKLQKVVQEVAFAAAFSETQPEISGVMFNFTGKVLTAAATDRYRLAEGTVELGESVKESRQVILPIRAVNELGRFSPEDMVEVFLTENQTSFKTADMEVVTRLIDGQYPDYKQIIPQSFTTEAEFERGGGIQVVKAAGLFSSENNNINLEFVPQSKRITVKAQSAQVGESELTIDAELSGQKNSIIFNYRYLLECLNSLGDEKIKLKVIDGSSPAAITPAGRSDYLYMVMPIKV